MNKHILLSDLSRELELDRSNTRKFVLKQGIIPQKIRTPHSRGQLTLCITKKEAEQIRQIRKDLGYEKKKPISKEAANGMGQFYFIKLIPEYNKQRIKLGFSLDKKARLATFKTIAPTAKIIKSWPCKKAWENIAIDCALIEKHTVVGYEVFDFDLPEKVIERLDQFFGLLVTSAKSPNP